MEGHIWKYLCSKMFWRELQNLQCQTFEKDSPSAVYALLKLEEKINGALRDKASMYLTGVRWWRNPKVKHSV